MKIVSINGPLSVTPLQLNCHITDKPRIQKWPKSPNLWLICCSSNILASEAPANQVRKWRGLIKMSTWVWTQPLMRVQTLTLQLTHWLFCELVWIPSAISLSSDISQLSIWSCQRTSRITSVIWLTLMSFTVLLVLIIILNLLI